MFEKGTVLLNSDHESLVDVIDEMIQDFCDSGHMNKENREQVKRTLLSHHRHNQSSLITGGSGAGLQRKKSTISDLFNPSSRRPSTFIHQPQSSNNEQATNLLHTDDSGFGNHHSRKQFSEFNLSSKMESLKISKSASTTSQNLSVSDANLVQQQNQNYRNMSVKRNSSIRAHSPGNSSSHLSSRHNSAIANITTSTNEYNSHLSPHNLAISHQKASSNTCIPDENNNGGNLNVTSTNTTGGGSFYTKRRRSTIALIKNTLNKTSNLNKV